MSLTAVLCLVVGGSSLPARADIRPVSESAATQVTDVPFAPTASPTPPLAAVEGGLTVADTPACFGAGTTRLACVQVKPGRAAAIAPRGHGRSILPAPLWCTPTFKITRTEACIIYNLTYTTYVIEEGVQTVTGVASMDVYSFSYTSVSIPTVGHQLQVSTYAGWGDALKANVFGTASGSGSCRMTSAAFAPQPLLPLKTLRSGEAYHASTATKVGAVGRCATRWTLSFANAPYTTGTAGPYSMNVMRCDHKTGGNGFRKPRPGCVVAQYITTVNYSKKAYPELAGHVARAQASGLPGAKITAPLTRTTNDAINKKNRRLACGKAPKVKQKTCDEYPLASTKQGLSAGGKLRTFKGCKIKAPLNKKGAKGASACMINSKQNNAQGALMAAFWYDWRVLDGDRFIVKVTA